ncbi:MAG: hypothetical protein AAF497_13715 [Planctomycetota bacterium]
MRLCIVCKSQIEAERIEGIPATRLCLKHGKEIIAYGGEFKISVSQERTSKQGSLKLNYGGISTASLRNEAGLNRLIDDYEKQQFDNE